MEMAGRQALDEVDVGLVHLAQELAGVGREGLDVAALALGVDGVEGQGGLARAGQPGEDDQPVPGQVERDVSQVVLASSANDQTVGHLGEDTGGVCHVWSSRSWCSGAAGRGSGEGHVLVAPVGLHRGDEAVVGRR